MATFSTLDFVIDSGIARITLNRPDAANGISMQLAQELLQASLACRCSTAVRAVRSLGCPNNSGQGVQVTSGVGRVVPGTMTTSRVSLSSGALSATSGAA